MKRKSLTVKSKADKKQVSTINLKIRKIYIKFKDVIFKKIKKENFALAVSGGSDSLCLAYLCQLYQFEYKNKIHVLIVNHRLRKKSYEEALKVKKILKEKNIKSTILNWKGKIPKSNIQQNARNIRYSLIANYCSIQSLFPSKCVTYTSQ